MKGKQAIRLLGMIIIVLVSLVPVAPAFAQVVRSIELEPDSGKIGDKVTVTGTGFNKSTETTDKYAAIILSSQEATTLEDIDDDVVAYERVKEGVWLNEDGDFRATFTVPDELDDGKVDVDVTSGTYYVYVCHYQSISPVVLAPRIRAVATFTVIKGEISISPKRGTVGTLIEITGTDFSGSTSLTFRYDDYVVPVDSGNKKTSSLGGFISIIQVPDSVAGPHTVGVIASDIQVSKTFTVNPEIILSSTSGEVDKRVTITGTGFSSRANIDIWFHNLQVAIATTNAVGNFSLSFKVPDLDAGLYNVEAEGLSNIAKAKFTIVTPSAQPAPSPTPITPAQKAIISISTTVGSVGQAMVTSGASFKAGGVVAIKYDGQTVTTTSADSNGLFAASFVIPASKYGEHIITADDGVNVIETKFTVESIPPPIPTLLSPEPGDKLQAPITFYWMSVSDDSQPVTYDLQIANGKVFTGDSIIIEKKGLAKTEYTITKADQSKLVRTKAPYYWRVKAVDGASNEGNWASQGMFYVPPAFPVWAWLAIIACSLIIIFVLGYLLWRTNLLGKRGASA